MNFKFILFYYFLKYRFLIKITSKEKLSKFQRRKIEKHLKYITKHSNFYSKYTGKKLEEFPIIDKKMMMDNFNNMNTVGIKKEIAYNIALESEKARDFQKKYNNITVGLSSGTTGSRGIFLASNFERAKWAGIILAKLLPDFILKRNKLALFLRANSELFGTVNSKLLKFQFFDMILDYDENIRRLNSYNPDILIAPASMLKLLAENIEKIKIRPSKIFSCAEVLLKEDKEFISKKFNVNIGEIYQATEGFLGYSDNKNDNIMINEDTLFIEKEYIDNEKKRFIPIITDFERKSQPIIRYRLNDIWIEKDNKKNTFLRLEKVEGRENDIFLFYNKDNKEIKIFPDFIQRIMMFSSDDISEYRVLQKNKYEVEISYTLKEGTDKVFLNKEIVKNFYEFLKKYDIEVQDIKITFVNYLKNDKLTKNRRVARGF